MVLLPRFVCTSKGTQFRGSCRSPVDDSPTSTLGLGRIYDQGQLQLDRREALEAGYRKTHKRILIVVELALQEDTIDADALCEQLDEVDDHGLLGWYLSGTGQNLNPFCELRAKHPAAWAACVAQP